MPMCDSSVGERERGERGQPEQRAVGGLGREARAMGDGDEQQHRTHDGRETR